MRSTIEFRDQLDQQYPDILNTEVVAVLNQLVDLNVRCKDLMQKRLLKRQQRFADRQRIGFLDNDSVIAGTAVKVKDARAAKFVGSDIPKDLQRQWVQGTGAAAKPSVSLARSLRNVAFALLSGADGWMFDGEDALGQTGTLCLDNQRNIKLAIRREQIFLTVAQQVASEMNVWSQGFLHRDIVSHWRQQLDFTTIIYRPRGLHLDDRHIQLNNGEALCASLVDTTLFIANNYKALLEKGLSLVLYLPKIQTAEEAGLWQEILSVLEQQLGLSTGTIKTYVLVEQLEATFQLMEIRAVLANRFVGFNTGRWDYINSVADATSWDEDFINPDITSITMTFAYMKNYEERVRSAVNTPDLSGRSVLWHSGMETNIPVGSDSGVAHSMQQAVNAAERECNAGASGKWVAHWKMVHLIRPVWQKLGRDNQLGKSFPALLYGAQQASDLYAMQAAPRTLQGVRDLLSVALQYGNAFLTGMQAAALKPADYFSDDSVLYLMEDMATGEIRLSILWEWIHKKATLTQADLATQTQAGTTISAELVEALLQREYEKLLSADDNDVHGKSKQTTLPIAKEIVQCFIFAEFKLPWHIDLLNLNLNHIDLAKAETRIQDYSRALLSHCVRITENLDF